MKLSCCIGTNIERLEIIHKLGYKYCEPGLAAIAGQTDEAFAAFKAKLEQTGIKPVAANGMFPASVNLLLGEEGYPAVREYLDKALPRATELNIPIIILGSGPSRKIPDGMTVETATERFVAVTKDVIAPMCAEYGIVIGIEELRAAECNFINTCKEAMEIIRKVDRPNVKLLLDFYHAVLGGDTLEELESYGKEYIVHAHYGSPVNDRKAPKRGVDEHLVKEYFDMFARIGYDGGFSLEGLFENFETEAKEALEIMEALS